MRSALAACLGISTLFLAGLAYGHHSFSMFDRSREITAQATVRQFQWTNPHSWIEVDLKNDRGGTDHWSIECNSPNNLSREGWTSSSVKPGDKITISFWPLKNGEKGGLFLSLKFDNGQMLYEQAFRTATAKQP
jgi:hypothetical protein